MIVKTTFLLFAFACFLVSCKSAPKNKKYYIVIKQKERDIVSGYYSPSVKIDSIEVETDSIAYWKGIFAYGGGLRAGKLLKEKGYDLPTVTENFDVLNSEKISILPFISETNKKTAMDFLNKHTK
jgi:hypothetical protein